jgi:hypothetical protein
MIIRFDEIPEYCELIEIDEFIKAVHVGAYTNYDGIGYISNGKVVFDIPVDLDFLANGIKTANVSTYPAEFTFT